MTEFRFSREASEADFSFCPFLFHLPPSRSDLPHHRPKPLYVPVTRNNESTFCTRDQYLAPRVAFITWLVTFFLEKKYVSSAAVAQGAKNGTEVIPKLIQVRILPPPPLLFPGFIPSHLFIPHCVHPPSDCHCRQ